MKKVALQNQGITLLSDFIAGAELKQGMLRTVLDNHHPPKISLCAIYPRHRHLSIKTRLFVDKLAETFGLDAS